MAGVVLFYLMRVEPFTSLHVELQAGKFDVPDRLFMSLAHTWSSCLTSLSSFKELIPEFYYFPDFLENINGFDLGNSDPSLYDPLIPLPGVLRDRFF